MITRILDSYYHRPLLYDIIINALVVAFVIIIEYNEFYSFSFDETSQVIPSIGITISGFILTMLTILLTLKSNFIINKSKNKEFNSINSFRIFLSSNLYSNAVSILKNGVIFLLMISFLTLGMSVVVNEVYASIGIYLNLICFTSTILVFLRCFYILNLILNMQSKDSKSK